MRDDRAPAAAPNECWSMDFLSDQLFVGRKIRVLSIIDNFSRARGPVGSPWASWNSSNRIWMSRSSSRRLFAENVVKIGLHCAEIAWSGQWKLGGIVFPGIENGRPAVARVLYVAGHETEIMF